MATFGVNGPAAPTGGDGLSLNTPAPDRFSTSTTPPAPTFTQPSAVPTVGGNWATGGGSVATTTQDNQTPSSGNNNAAPATSSTDSSTPATATPATSETPSSNTTPSSGGGDSGAGAVTTSAPSGGGILDNPLNPYAAPTYHFRLYVTGPKDDGTQVTIAETGKTGFNIKDVKMQGYYGPNPTTRNTNQTSLTIT
ncbi:MAG: hypothetical protein EOO77_07130, partial [Oxalobacteraceae bacterium]